MTGYEEWKHKDDIDFYKCQIDFYKGLYEKKFKECEKLRKEHNKEILMLVKG